jgi:peptidylprolyl isomerase
MKLRTLAAAMAAFALVPALAAAQTTAAPAAPAAAPAMPDKATLSYAIGYDMARDLAERKVDLDVNTLIRAIQDGYAKREPTMPRDKLGAALQAFTQRMAEQSRAAFEAERNKNRAASTTFLNANKAKTGVQVLASGVQYRVIEAGTGAKPTAASTVQVHLRGSLGVTGQEFTNTYQSPNAQPVQLKIGEVPVKGLRDALLMMPTGSRWEVFLPPEQAYGDNPNFPGGPAQALVFDVKLVGVK